MKKMLLSQQQFIVLVNTYKISVVQAEYSYDPWGGRLDPETRTYYAPGEEPELMFGRGYTGHEHLPEYGLIHMNARLYDPQTGRFLSPDPYVQDPANTQSYNRYAYALNNPMRYIDPSGEIVYTYDYDRRCYVDEYGNRVDNSVVHYAMFQNGYFRGPVSIYGGGGYWGTPSYVVAGSGGAAPGYTWQNVYTSINTAEANMAFWSDGTRILGEVTSVGVLFRYQVPTDDIFACWGMLGQVNDGLGFVIGGIENSAANALDRTMAYHNSASKITPPQTMIKVPGGSIHIPTQVLTKISKGLKVGGWVSGGIGLYLTYRDIKLGEKSFIGEGGLDLVMGGIAFVPGWGWIASGVYFGGKMILDVTGNDF